MFYGRHTPKLNEPRTLEALSTSGDSGIFVVTRDEAKHHMRVEHTDDDLYIDTLIEAAERYCETATDRTFLNKRLQATWDGFPLEIRLPKPPVVQDAPAFVITYKDGAQNTVIMSDSEFRAEYSEPCVLRPPYSQTWPTALSDISSVTVSWNAGYSASHGGVPAGIKHAVLMIVGHLYERRLAFDTLSSIEVPLGVKALLSANAWGQYR